MGDLKKIDSEAVTAPTQSGFLASAGAAIRKGVYDTAAAVSDFAGTMARGDVTAPAFLPEDQPQVDAARDRMRELSTLEQTRRREARDPGAGLTAPEQAEREAMQNRVDRLTVNPGYAQAVKNLQAEGANSYQLYGADPNAPNAAAQVGRGLGTVTASLPYLAGGLPLAGAQMAGNAYEETRAGVTKQLQAQGDTDQDKIDVTANQAALKQAAATLPQLGAYYIGGNLGARIAGKMIARGAGGLAEGLTQFAGAAVANVGTSSVIRALSAEDGQRLDAAIPTVESLTADTLFAAVHGINAYRDIGQVVRLRAADELQRRGFDQKQIEAPALEGEFTQSDDDTPADALKVHPVPPPAPEPGGAQEQFESQLATQQQVQRGATTVVLGAKGAEYPAVYAWAPRSLLQPSHMGETMSPNPDYPLTNTRDYSDPAERDKALETRNTWDPRRAITDSPDAAVGPPMVARVIDEDGNASLAVVGGNNRQWAMQNLSPEQQAKTLAQSNAKAGNFGLQPTDDPEAQIMRHLGTFDFRKPGERARLQGMVDALNPSPGMVQGTAKRAEIDAASVPPEQLGDLSMDMAPAEAQAAVRGLIERGAVDRNRTAAIAGSGSQSQDYIQRLLVNAGFQVPQIAEARNDARASNATLRGLIDAATPALVRLRQRGANDVANSIARSFATIGDTARNQSDKLPQAIQTVAAQHELDPVHAPAQAIAQGLAERLVLDKAGKVQSEPTIEAARAYFGQIARAAEEHLDQPDLWGEQRTMAQQIAQAAGLHAPSAEPEEEPMVVREEDGEEKPEKNRFLRQSWDEVQVGDPIDKIKGLIPKDPEAVPKFYGKGTPEQIAEQVKMMLLAKPYAVDLEGQRVLIANPEGRGADPILTRAWHLVGVRAKDLIRNDRTDFSPEKVRTVRALWTTIENYHVKVRDGKELLYFRRYSDGTLHMVVVDPYGRTRDHETTLISQYPPESKRFPEGVTVAKRPPGSAVSAEAEAKGPTTPQPSPEASTATVASSSGQDQPTGGATNVKDDGVDPSQERAYVQPYLDAKGIVNPTRRDAATAEFARWLGIRNDGSLQRPYRQLDLGLDAGAVRARGGDQDAGGGAALAHAPTAAELAGANAVQTLARGVGMTPAELESSFAGGDTISTIIPRLISLEIPRIDWRGVRIQTIADWAILHRALRTPYVESFKVAIVHPTTREIVKSAIISTGTLDSTSASAREVIQLLAGLPELTEGKRYQVYEAHNHPSGVPTPSSADRSVYAHHREAIQAAGAILMDEAVTNGDSFYSIAQERELPFPGGPELAPWELKGRRDLQRLTHGGDLPIIAQALRTSDPQHLHVIYGNTQLAISAIQRLPANLKGDELARAIQRTGIQQGAKYAWISAPFGDTLEARDYLTAAAERLNRLAKLGNAPFVADVSTVGVLSFAAANYIAERSAKYHVPGLAELAVQARALETLREEPAGYTGIVQASAGGAHADVPLRGLDDIKIIQMPEMVQLARELGATLDLRRMGPLGTFRALGTGQIALDPRIFANPVEAAKVLSHEIGHLASWFPQLATTSRGNLHGHLHSLNRFLQDRFGAANTSNREMRQELIAVTRYWRPYDPATAKPGYVSYRESSSELYADAVSVLFNSPATLKEMAPKFYREFFRGLDTKPEVKAAFFEVQNWLHAPMIANLIERAGRVDKMFAQAQEIFERKWQEREERYRGFRGWLSRLKQGFYDNYAPILDREAAAGQRGAADSARFLFDEHPLAADNQSYRWLERMHRTVAQPAEVAGFSLDDVGRLLFYNRIANERYDISEAMQERLASPVGGRSVIANPQGHTPETARLGLLAMRLENGMRGQTLLESAVQRFHDLVFGVMQDAHAAGLLTDEQMQLVRSNRDHYATFTPLEYVDLYLPAGFFPQAGTLKEIQNPFVSTVSKVLTMMRAIEHQRAKATAVRILTRDFPAEIQRAETRRDANGRETPRPPRERGIDQIMLREAGRPAWYNVPKEIALMFQRPDVPLLSSALELLNTPFRKFFYPLFITYNPVFQLVRNPIRDARRSYVNLPGGIGFEAIRQLPVLKQIGPNPALDAVRAFIRTGQQHPLIAEMLDNVAITPGEATFTATAGQPVNSFDRLLQQFGVLPEDRQTWRATRLPIIGHALEAIETAGRMNELLPKVSAYRLMRNRGWSPRDAAFYVRSYIGTPNFSKRGTHIGLANPIFPFVNIWMRGWGADLELMRHGFQRTDDPAAPGKSAASWWFRWSMSSGIWTVMKAAASLGLLGVAAKKLMDGISDHYKTNYDVLPIGRVGTSDFDPKGKVAFIPIPKDPADRIISGILYNTLRAAGGAAAQSGALGDDLKAANVNVDTQLATMLTKNLSLGASDVPGLNPMLKLGAAWQTYLTGQNPVDDYRGQYVLSDGQFLAGGWDALKPMLAWSYKQTGASSFVSFDPNAGMTLEQAANLPLINGMVKITDYGYREKQQAGQRLEQDAQARLRLGMPANAQQLAGEYGFLSRLSANARTPAQEARFKKLTAWHREYRVAEEQLWTAKENELSPDDQDGIRQRVQELSKSYERKP